MRGSPVLRAALVLVVLMGLAPLLWHLTHPAVAMPVAAQPRPAAQSPKIEGRLTFSNPAKRVVVQHLGRDVWSKDSPGMNEDFAFSIPWPKEGVELHALVTWPAGTLHAAMRFQLTAPDGREHDRTVWGDEEGDEVLVFE